MNTIIEDMAIEAHEAKKALQEATERYAKAESALIEELTIRDKDAFTSFNTGREITAKIVSAEKVRFDQAGIRKEIGRDAFLLLSNLKLDQHKVRDALVAGTVDPLVIQKYTETYHAKPYLIFSEGEIVDRD